MVADPGPEVSQSHKRTTTTKQTLSPTKEAMAALDPNTYSPKNKVSIGCIVRGLGEHPEVPRYRTGKHLGFIAGSLSVKEGGPLESTGIREVNTWVTQVQDR